MIDWSKKILLPYRQVPLLMNGNWYVRDWLMTGYDNFVFLCRDFWRVRSEYNTNAKLYLLDTEDAAKQCLDGLLIKNGCKLLNTIEEADKYRCLL